MSLNPKGNSPYVIPSMWPGSGLSRRKPIIMRTFQKPTVGTDIYKGSFFPQTIPDWKALPESVISSAEIEDGFVAKFTSLVRAHD